MGRKAYAELLEPAFPIDPADPIPLSRDDVGTRFKDGVLFIPDLHGTAENIDYLKRVISEEDINWVGLEHFPRTLQTVIEEVLEHHLSNAQMRVVVANAISYFAIRSGDPSGKVLAPKQGAAIEKRNRQLKELGLPPLI